MPDARSGERQENGITMGVIAQPADSSTFRAGRGRLLGEGGGSKAAPRDLVQSCRNAADHDDHADGLPAQHGGASIVARTAPGASAAAGPAGTLTGARAGLAHCRNRPSDPSHSVVAPRAAGSSRAPPPPWSSVPDGSGRFVRRRLRRCRRRRTRTRTDAWRRRSGRRRDRTGSAKATASAPSAAVCRPCPSRAAPTTATVPTEPTATESASNSAKACARTAISRPGPEGDRPGIAHRREEPATDRAASVPRRWRP